ncbi:MAG: hypothetical protein KC418_08960 [Anaerolineales bacterium]|nr:hypothetical protein [Anaerolineales bacterium]
MAQWPDYTISIVPSSPLFARFCLWSELLDSVPTSYNAHMAQIQFFDDPSQMRKSREEVRINEIGLHVYPDGRRVAVGFDLTPFLERPSLEVVVRNAVGEIAGTLNVIEALQPNFHLTMHLRDAQPAEPYTVLVTAYYVAPGEKRQIVDQRTAHFSLADSRAPQESE